MKKEFTLWLTVLVVLLSAGSYLANLGVTERYVTPERPFFVVLHWLYLLLMAYIFVVKIGVPFIVWANSRK